MDDGLLEELNLGGEFWEFLHVDEQAVFQDNLATFQVNAK